MKIDRKYTTAGQEAYAGIEFVTTSSEIRNPDGSKIGFAQTHVRVDFVLQ